MSTTQVTYSEPTVTRTAAESRIEFDVADGAWTGWDLISIARDAEGDISIDGRGEGAVQIPAQFLPLVLAEIDRIVAGDGDAPLAPFAPVAAVQHVASGVAA